MDETNASAPDRLLRGLLFAVTVVTGLVDAVSFLALGHVFTANMTGNVVFLGFATAGVSDLSLLRSGAALATFVGGAAVGGRLAERITPGAARIRGTAVGFAIEGVLLLLAAAAAIGAPRNLLNDPPRLYALISLTGFAMGIRNAQVRKLGERDLTTTVLTMTIAALAADSSPAGGTNSRWARRLTSVLLMFVGAAGGALLLRCSVALPLAVGGCISSGCAIGARFARFASLGALPRDT